MTLPNDNPPDREQAPTETAPEQGLHDTPSMGGEPLPASDRPDPIRPLVEEIRARLVEVAARESELVRRERELFRSQQPETQVGDEDSGTGTTEAPPREAETPDATRQPTIEEMLDRLERRGAEFDRVQGEIRRRLGERLKLFRQYKAEFVEKIEAARAQIWRRKDSLARDRATLEAELAEVAERRDVLERRGVELDQRTAETRALAESLDARQAELDARQAEVDRRADELAEAGREVDARVQALEQRGQTLVVQQAELAESQQALQRQQAELRRRSEEIEQQIASRSAALASADAAATERRAALDEQAAGLATEREECERRRSELSRREEELGSRVRELDERSAALDVETARADRQREALENQTAELSRERAELSEKGANLRKRENDLKSTQASLAERTRTLLDREQDLETRGTEREEEARQIGEKQAALGDREQTLDRQREELGAWERTLEERQAALTSRAEELAGHESAVREQTVAAEARVEELEHQAAAIDERRAAVDKLYQQAIEIKEQTRKEQQEIAELRRQHESREAELRRASLQTEIDREHIQRDYATLLAEQQRLAELEDREEETSADTPLIEQPAAAETEYAEPPSRRRRGWILCTLAGVLAALAWWVIDQPRYRGVAEIRISSERGAPDWVAGEHVDWIMSGALAEYWQGPPPVGMWLSACDGGHVVARPLPERQSVELTLETANADAARTVLSAAGTAYAAYVDQLPLERFRSSRLLDWTEQKDAIEVDLSQRGDRCRNLEASMADSPAAAARRAAQDALDQTLAESKQVDARLAAQRDELTALQSQELPRGLVPAEAYQQALADDALYQEDLKEFRAEARQYRTELAVSMVLMAEPLGELRKRVQASVDTMIEQRDLQPPAEVSALLEQCLAEMQDFNKLVAEFAQSWDQRREKIERLKVEEQLVELVTQREQVADSARRLVEESKRVLGVVDERIEGLGSDGDAGTRAIVVASVLRGDMSRVSEQSAALAEAAKATDPAVNFRLDAHDRQVRGIRTRLKGRQQRLRDQLQADADRAARAGHDEQVRELEEAISAADQRRQELMATLLTHFESLRQLDEQNQELAKLAAELRLERAAMERLERRLAELEADRPQPRRDTVELVAARHEQVNGDKRYQNAALVGVGGFAASGVLLLLMFAGGSRRGTHDEGGSV